MYVMKFLTNFLIIILSVYQLRLKVLKNIGSPVKNYIKA